MVPVRDRAARHRRADRRLRVRHRPEDSRQAEVGFTLRPEFQGQGYATEAAGALLGYLFGARAKHRVSARCDPRNAASMAVLERLGMRREGHLVESTWAKGEWTDDVLFAILAPGVAARPALSRDRWRAR